MMSWEASKVGYSSMLLKFSISSATIVNSNLTISVTFPVFGNTVGNLGRRSLRSLAMLPLLALYCLIASSMAKLLRGSPATLMFVDKAVDSVLICRQTRRFVLIIVFLLLPSYIWFTL